MKWKVLGRVFEGFQRLWWKMVRGRMERGGWRREDDSQFY